MIKLTSRDGEVIFINPSTIGTIQDSSRGGCYIYTTVCKEPFTVKEYAQDVFELIEKDEKTRRDTYAEICTSITVPKKNKRDPSLHIPGGYVKNPIFEDGKII